MRVFLSLCYPSFRHRRSDLTICRESAAIEDPTIYYPLLSLLTSHLPLLQPEPGADSEGSGSGIDEDDSASRSKPRISNRDQLEMIYDLISNYDSHETTTHNPTSSSSSSSRSTLTTAHPKFDLSSFKTSLAMHEASPKIQAYYQFYNTVISDSPAGREVARKEEERASMGGQGYVCESWVEWRGKGFCNVDELRRDMELSLDLGSTEGSGRASG
jgi:hypothetical protein